VTELATKLIGGLSAVFLLSVTLPAELYISGAGATFPAPLYQRWISEYASVSDLRVQYESVGSSAGMEQFLRGQVDFAAVDIYQQPQFLDDSGKSVIYIPTAVGGVVIVYHIKGLQGLNFSPEAISGIYSGKITRWNDGLLRQLNPGSELPNIPITVIHRSDRSGTSFVFTEYLSSVSGDWAQQIGTGSSVDWPVGIGVNDNSGVLKYTERIEGAIGYMSLSYTLGNRLQIGRIMNSSGVYIIPGPESIALAAESDTGKGIQKSITNTQSHYGYPIAAFTYLVIHSSEEKAASNSEYHALLDFIWWAVHDGQAFCGELGYSPLPPGVVKRTEELLQSAGYGTHDH